MLQPGLCFVSAGLVAFAAARSGGYFPEDYLLIGAVALVGCAAGLAGAGPQWRPTPTALFALVCITGFAVWTGLSAAWSPDPGGASLAMARTLGYAAAFLLAMLAVGNGRHAALLLRLLVLVLVGLGMLALLGRLRPDLFAGGSNVTYPAQGRLGSIITYSNGLGAVSAMAVIGAIALASDARELVVTRALAAAGGVLVTCTMYLTLSRGTGIAFAAGLAVILVASPRRGRLAVATLITLGGGLAGILLLRQHPILIDLPGTAAARRAEGGPLVGKLLLVAMAAGGLQAAFARLQRSREGSSRVAGRPSRSTPPVLAAAPIIVILLALAGTYLAVGARVEGGANSAGSGVQSFLDRQYVSFMNPVSAAPQGQDRLISAQSSRSDAYRVALDGLRAHPIAGDGAAGYRVRWFRQRRGLEDLRNAHSLELETLSELGVVGGVLLLGFLGSLLFGLRSMVRRRGTITRTQAAGAGGILVVWVMHSALDWDWQLAAVTLPALICGALCLAPDRPPVPPAPPRAASPGAR
ncbi:MAG: hypothetical protein JWM31_2484 [Solirubrobacterales bacterium]|nr:hypothetical protein [Solirubrobacterales bacterium]